MPTREEMTQELVSVFDEWEEQALRSFAKDAQAATYNDLDEGTLVALYENHLHQKELQRQEQERQEVEAKQEMENYMKTMAPIENRIDAAIKEAGAESGITAVVVNYSAYETHKDGSVIDNLDEVAIDGTVRFTAPRDDFWGGEESAPYESPEVTNPTWLQVAVFANDMIWRTNDHHHVFLEGISEAVDGKVEFYMGS